MNNEDKPRYIPENDVMVHKVREVLWKKPAQIETVLLPFKGKIIYDSFIGSMSIGFGEGARALFCEAYDKAIKHGVITSLE